MKTEQISRLVQILRSSKNTVAITGAGVSTEAGIPDFRGKDGLYTKIGGEEKAMSLININAFKKNPAKYYEFHWQRFDFPQPEPCKAHKVLADMENNNLLKGVITQNIDGLHQKAGGRNVIPIHGRYDQFICMACKELHSREYARAFAPGIPLCGKCGAILKPNVVLFGENIQNYSGAKRLIKKARCLLAIGTSLTVYPLAGMVKGFSTLEQDLVIINKGPTSLDYVALLKAEVEEEDSLGEILETVYKELLPQSF